MGSRTVAAHAKPETALHPYPLHPFSFPVQALPPLSAKHAFGSRNGLATAPGPVREPLQAKLSAPYLCLLCWPLSQWVSAVPGKKGDPESAGREVGLLSTRHRVGPHQQRAQCSRHSHTRKAVGYNPEAPLIHPDVPGGSRAPTAQGITSGPMRDAAGAQPGSQVPQPSSRSPVPPAGLLVCSARCARGVKAGTASRACLW